MGIELTTGLGRAQLAVGPGVHEHDLSHAFRGLLGHDVLQVSELGAVLDPRASTLVVSTRAEEPGPALVRY